MNWLELARVLVEALVKRIEAADDMRAEKRDGRTVMPPFAELSAGAYDDRAFARDLLRTACKADPRLRDALVVVATLAKDVDHDTLRELVSVLPLDEA
jgi:hypothetical protein